MDNNLTEIIVVLDESGSMQGLANDVRGSFNKFMDEQAAVAGECRVTLCNVATTAKIVFTGKDVKSVEKLTESNYKPDGMTALFDGIGISCDGAGKRFSEMAESNRPGKVVVLILTDGEENQSKEYSQERIKQIITDQQSKYAWQFVFVGSNQDAITAGSKIGISAAYSLNMANNAKGMANAFGSASANLASYRSGATMDCMFLDQDRKAQKDASKN